MRRFVIALAHDRSEVFRRLIAARAGSFSSLFSLGFGSATMVDAEKFCAQFLPEQVPDDFGALQIPLTVIATDLYRRQPVAFAAGALRPAIAASIALPTVMRPVVVDGRVLIDGGATNPLPFDELCAGAPTSSSRSIFRASRARSGATSPIRGSASPPPSWSWAVPSPPKSSSAARPT